ncbi:MAG: hypothetical protein J6Y78_16215 [Paludibacteraceae bacterium]|nr:hypothetical protein [Paludibacteraceae bacterium]
MPATYIPEFQGYIADVPRMWFKRCDGRVFYFDELTQASVSPQVNYTEVNAGWSLFPVAYLPGQSTFEMQVTSGKFEADLFVMTNATKFQANANYEVPFTEILTLDGQNEVELTNDPVTGSVSIAGLEETASTPTAGHFKVTAAAGANPAKITFAASDVEGGKVEVNYFYKEAAQEANITNQSSAMGEAIMVYPVYGNGDDCTDSSIIGHVYVRVYKCRVTAQPGFDASYKTANTFQFTIAAMDAKRQDQACYSIAFIKLPED